jgi:hypothetical protein
MLRSNEPNPNVCNVNYNTLNIKNNNNKVKPILAWYQPFYLIALAYLSHHFYAGIASKAVNKPIIRPISEILSSTH